MLTAQVVLLGIVFAVFRTEAAQLLTTVKEAQLLERTGLAVAGAIALVVGGVLATFVLWTANFMLFTHHNENVAWKNRLPCEFVWWGTRDDGTRVEVISVSDIVIGHDVNTQFLGRAKIVEQHEEVKLGRDVISVAAKLEGLASHVRIHIAIVTPPENGEPGRTLFLSMHGGYPTENGFAVANFYTREAITAEYSEYQGPVRVGIGVVPQGNVNFDVNMPILFVQDGELRPSEEGGRLLTVAQKSMEATFECGDI